MINTILVVDDKEELRTLLEDYLTKEGFRIVTATSGREALFIARNEKPDLVILDLMMPEMSGYEFIRVYSKESDVPIIILTAKLQESDKILGLEMGADDYITKPFSMRELTARIRAVLRRTGKKPTKQEILRAADITLNHKSHIVTIGEKYVDLTPSEFDLLATLMSKPGQVFSRLELLNNIQGSAFEGYERNIDVHIRNLRAKIEQNPSNPSYIETVYGVGYRFTTQITKRIR